MRQTQDDVCETPASLGEARRGFVGVIERLDASGYAQGIDAEELERRLLELGFVEGARVEVLHEGAFGRDPIAVRVLGLTVALRRQEARAVRLKCTSEAPADATPRTEQT